MIPAITIKPAIPKGSQFSKERAIELADMVEVAYQQYDNYTADPRQEFPKEGEILSIEARDYKILKELFFPCRDINDSLPFGFILSQDTDNAPPDIFVVFRGTRAASEWVKDFKSVDQINFLDNPNFGKVGEGFAEIYTRDHDGENRGYASLQQTIRDTLSNPALCPPNSQIFVTGHSLGSALATLAGLDIAIDETIAANLGNCLPNVYTFASPRVGDCKFAQSYFEHQIPCYRVANSEDIVTTLPIASRELLGEDMQQNLTTGREKTIAALDKILDFIIRDVVNKDFEHVGEPIYFTWQVGSISYNHNMQEIYREAINSISS
ncbi:MAG: lipase family protein [Pseudanabaena sp. ELA607]|jgi:hypothetical protein